MNHTDPTAALRDRIADAATPFLMNFSDEEAAKVNAGELAAAVLAVFPEPPSRAAVLREAADRIDRTDLPQDFVDMFDNGARWATAELRRLAVEAQQQPETEAPADTLPAWLLQRFDPRGPDWANLTDDDRAYWEHQARAVRRAVARGGFKPAPEPAAADSEETRCPAKHGALGRICELPPGHRGMHTGSGPNGGAVWDGSADD